MQKKMMSVCGLGRSFSLYEESVSIREIKLYYTIHCFNLIRIVLTAKVVLPDKKPQQDQPFVFLSSKLQELNARTKHCYERSTLNSNKMTY